MKKSICLTIVILLVSGVARADFVLTGTQHLDVTYNVTTGILWDSSSVDILDGEVWSVEAHNASTVNFFDEYVDTINAYDSSIVNIAGPHISKLNAWDSTVVNILPYSQVNGPCVLRNNSIMVISGGFFAGNLLALDTSNITITGGNFRADHATYLITSGSSTVDISGGYVNDLRTQEISTITISGGRVQKLAALGTSAVSIK